MNPIIKAAACVAALSSSAICLAQEQSSQPGSDEIEEIIVVGRSVSTTSARVIVERELLVDTATVLKEIPGADVNANGPITGIAQYRGLFGDRVAVSIDQQGVVSGGPNAMDAPLSYVSPMLTAELSVERGIASLSLAPESIGGHINASLARGEFSDGAFEVTGLIGSRFSGNGDVSTSAARLTLSSDRNRFSVIAESDQGSDVETPMGTIQPSQLNRDRYDLSYAFQNDNTKLLAYAGKLDTRDTGTAALPMDIISIDTDLFGLQVVQAVTSRVDIEGRVAYNDVGHVMDNYSLRSIMSPMMARQNNATGSGATYSLAGLVDRGTANLRIGIDGVAATHDSVITNPNMAMFRVDNFVAAERDLIGVFAEWRQSHDAFNWELGIRYKQVETGAGTVGASGMPDMMATIAAGLADDFNNANRNLSWNTVDAVFKYRHSLSSTVEWNFDIGSKTRAPSYQELYLWLPLQATGGLADGRTYIGNLNLSEERSNELVLGLSSDSGRFAVSPQIFYRKIDNYIQGIPARNAAANRLSVMMTGSPALQFENVDAEIWGLDVAWTFELSDSWLFDGIVSLADGQRTDVDDYLYRLSPLSGSLGLTFASGLWSAKTEVVFNARQDRVARYNGEKESAAYQLLNFGVAWDPIPALRVEARIENLLDETYQDHLAGVNRVVGGDLPTGISLYGVERTATVGLIYQF